MSVPRVDDLVSIVPVDLLGRSSNRIRRATNKEGI